MAAASRKTVVSTVGRDPGFFIHVLDPSFRDAEWAGEQRKGPYPTLDECLQQAASDLAHGGYSADKIVGVFSDADALKHRDDPGSVVSRVPVAKIEALANTLIGDAAKHRALTYVEAHEALRQALPEGVDVDAFIKKSGMRMLS